MISENLLSEWVLSTGATPIVYSRYKIINKETIVRIYNVNNSSYFQLCFILNNADCFARMFVYENLFLAKNKGNSVLKEFNFTLIEETNFKSLL